MFYRCFTASPDQGTSRRGRVPASGLDAVFFVDCVPDVVFVDGLFHVTYEIGRDARLEVVMLPAIFAKAMLLANEANAQWQFGTMDAGNVTQIRRR